MPATATERLDSLWRGLSERSASITQGARHKEIKTLASLLQSFGFSQIEFTLGEPNEQDALREYRIATIINQICSDLEVIERAAYQRRDKPSGALAATLALADSLIYRALEPALPLLESGQVPLAYINKAPNIRVIPYAPVALVGIPYSTLASEPNDPEADFDISRLTLKHSFPDWTNSLWQDFLAIPHEVGHYVYSHARFPHYSAPGDTASSRTIVAELGERLADKRFEKDPKVRPWLEEIFADVYGCLIAGPILAIDFQDLQLNRNDTDLPLDDGKHPIPLLRPEIYRHVLAKKISAEYATKVDDLWQERLGKRKWVNKIQICDRQVDLDKNRIIRELETVVDVILDFLIPALDLGKNGTQDQLFWPTRVTLGKSTAKDIKRVLYKKFEQQIESFKKEQVKFPVLPNRTGDEATWNLLRERFRQDAKAIDSVNGKLGTPVSDLPFAQIAELWAGGWATEGPEHNWP